MKLSSCMATSQQRWGCNMSKKANLAKVFAEQEQPQKPDVVIIENKVSVKPSRVNKKHIGGYFSIEVYKQMKGIGLEKDMTTQDILSEALNGFFERHNKPPIA